MKILFNVSMHSWGRVNVGNGKLPLHILKERVCLFPI